MPVVVAAAQHEEKIATETLPPEKERASVLRRVCGGYILSTQPTGRIMMSVLWCGWIRLLVWMGSQWTWRHDVDPSHAARGFTSHPLMWIVG
jgi:hypothetical protein